MFRPTFGNWFTGRNYPGIATAGLAPDQLAGGGFPGRFPTIFAAAGATDG